MAIYRTATLDEAQAIEGPSVIARDGEGFLVYTGDDMPPAGPGPLSRVLSVQEFRSRFTVAERRATIASTNLDVQDLVFLLSTRTEPVDLNDQQIVLGVDLLVAQGILQPERKDEILA